MAVWGREGQLGCGMLQKDPGGRRKHKVCCHCVTEFVAENSAICLSEGGCQTESRTIFSVHYDFSSAVVPDNADKPLLKVCFFVCLFVCFYLS